MGVVPLSQALQIASETGLDLVEVASQSSPPVCRIIDYGKYKYEQTKRSKDTKKKQKNIEMKELVFHPNIAEHDYLTKLNHIKRFLKKGAKVKVIMIFRKRELAHTELGMEVLKKIIKDLESLAQQEKRPSKEFKKLIMILGPKKPSKESDSKNRASE
jgi:translation initiation factor IF-3